MQATTLAVEVPRCEMRLARWVHSRPAPAEGERLVSTKQVSLLGGLDRDTQEWAGQDGDGCGNGNTHWHHKYVNSARNLMSSSFSE